MNVLSESVSATTNMRSLSFTSFFLFKICSNYYCTLFQQGAQAQIVLHFTCPKHNDQSFCSFFGLLWSSMFFVCSPNSISFSLFVFNSFSVVNLKLFWKFTIFFSLFCIAQIKLAHFALFLLTFFIYIAFYQH